MDILIRLMADGLMLPIVMLAGYGLLFRVDSRERYDCYTRIFMAGITSYWLAKIIGALWQPATLRPFEILGGVAGASYLDNPGFPSDHALFAVFLAIAIWYATKNRVLTGVMVALTALMCVGRVLALVHTPLDIAGGVVVALLGALWYIERFPTLRPVLAIKSRK